jgi:hypothetical protein
MNAQFDRREIAYWFTLAFHLGRVAPRLRNGLVLTADRKERLGLLDLVRIETKDLPASLRPFAEAHEKLLAAEGHVSAQAFVASDFLAKGFRILPITHTEYPPHLAMRLTPAASLTVLSVAGDVKLLEKPGVAISGSRNAGPEGLAFARAMGRALAEAGIPVVSGLARGVDREGLEGALEAGGTVIGVAPEGLLASRAPAHPMVKAGRMVVVSEFAPRQQWAAGLAMARNRTIAGLSRTLIVADCVAPGGTTEQVHIHRQLGLEVFVRRGTGEGALIDELARRPDVGSIHWNQGVPSLPASLGASTLVHATVPDAVATSVATTIQCRITRVNGEIEVSLVAPADAMLDSLVQAIRDHWLEPVHSVPTPLAHESRPVGLVGMAAVAVVSKPTN